MLSSTEKMNGVQCGRTTGERESQSFTNLLSADRSGADRDNKNSVSTASSRYSHSRSRSLNRSMYHTAEREPRVSGASAAKRLSMGGKSAAPLSEAPSSCSKERTGSKDRTAAIVDA